MLKKVLGICCSLGALVATDNAESATTRVNVVANIVKAIDISSVKYVALGVIGLQNVVPAGTTYKVGVNPDGTNFALSNGIATQAGATAGQIVINGSASHSIDLTISNGDTFTGDPLKDESGNAIPGSEIDYTITGTGFAGAALPGNIASGTNGTENLAFSQNGGGVLTLNIGATMVLGNDKTAIEDKVITPVTPLTVSIAYK